MSDKQVPVINPANGVTAARMLLFAPFWYAVDQGLYQWGLLIILIAGLLDKVDGLVARIFDCRSPFGEVFDAIADGVLYGVCLIVLTAYGWVPTWPVVAIFGLGVGNAIARFAYAKRLGRTANYHSWAMERFVAYTAFLIGFGVAQYEVDFYFTLAAATMGVIVLHDVKRMLLDPVPA